MAKRNLIIVLTHRETWVLSINKIEGHSNDKQIGLKWIYLGNLVCTPLAPLPAGCGKTAPSACSIDVKLCLEKRIHA